MNNEARGKFIAELRKEKNMTQEELGTLISYSRNNISKWERGLSFPNDPSVLEKLSEIFEVTLEEIMYGKRKTKNNTQQIINNLVNKYKNEYRKKRRIMSYFFISLMIIVLCIIATVYNIFIKDTVSLYRIYFENENFYMDESFLFVSNDNLVFSFNMINAKDSEKINYIKIYYVKNDEEIEIISGANDYYLLEEKAKNIKYDLYKLKKYDIYIDIQTDKHVYEKIKLNKEMKYINDKISYYNPDYFTGDNIDIREYNKDILLSVGFLKNDNDLYIKFYDDNKYILFNGNNIKMMYSYVDGKKEYITGNLNYDYYLFSIEENGKKDDFYLFDGNAKNCDVDYCKNYADYVEYLYYLKKIIIANNE